MARKDAGMGRPPYHHNVWLYPTDYWYQQWDHYSHYDSGRTRRTDPGRTRRTLGPAALLLFCAAILAGAGVMAVMMFTALVALAPFMLAGAATVVVTRRLRRRHRQVDQGRHPAMAPRPASPVPSPATIPDWRATRALFAQLRSEYGQFECDPLAVLRLPALTDVTVASTARFVDAFAEAQALDTDTEPPPAHHARFTAAVDQAWRAWHAAREVAERIRLAGIPEQERATVQRAIKLLTMARDSDHEAERRAAYSKARAELARLDRSGALRLPPAAAAALAIAARGQLPAAG